MLAITVPTCYIEDIPAVFATDIFCLTAIIDKFTFIHLRVAYRVVLTCLGERKKVVRNANSPNVPGDNREISGDSLRYT